MIYYIILLRLLHILAGVFWAGGVFFFAVFVLPSVNKMGPDGGKFMQTMVSTNNYSKTMITAALTTIISGIFLIERLSGGFQMSWISSNYGLALIIGGLFAITGFIFGVTVSLPNAKKATALGQAIASSGNPPSQEQMELMTSYRAKIKSGTHWLAANLTIAVILMAIARYII